MGDMFDQALEQFAARTRASVSPEQPPDTAVAVADQSDAEIIGDPDSHRQYVRAVWTHLTRKADGRGQAIYIYGAGAHSRWLMSVIDHPSESPFRGFLDDVQAPGRLGGFPIRSPQEINVDNGAVILISSDRYEDVLYARARAHFADRASIVRLYEGIPPGPYPQPQTRAERQRARGATRRARVRWGGSEFVGPYESAGSVTGFLQEQWLWSNRDRLCGHVLDMSTPKHWHAWIHQLPAVRRVSISDHDGEFVVKHRYHSKVDIQADFCDPNLPVNSRTFDTVICASILEHCEAPARMMENLNRVLADGGTLLLAVPFAGVDGHSQPDFWRFGQDGLTLLAEQAVFEQIQTGGLGDVGSMLDDILGCSNAANDHHHGLPLINWLLATKPRVC